MANIDFKNIWSLIKMIGIFVAICVFLPLYLMLRDL